MKILGIDPGTNITGYGIVEKDDEICEYVTSGIINLKKYKTIQDKLKNLYSEIMEIIKQYKPTAIALEDLFYAKNIKSTVKLAYAKGVIFLAASHAGLDVYEYSPTNVKSVASGYGRAGKEELSKLLCHLICKMPETFNTQDESDAIALAYCHISTESYNMRIV